MQPSLVILDDIDLSIGSRSAGGISKYLETFLDILDGTEKLSKQVGLIATTNSSALLDLAAQRPGRFDKVILFDTLTKENIINIIRKSLKYNFNIIDGNEYNTFISPKIIQKYYDASVTGAYIYNSINMIQLRVKTLHLENKFNENWLLNEIDMELKNCEKIKKFTEIDDKLNKEKEPRRMGFGNYEEEGQDECVCIKEESRY